MKIINFGMVSHMALNNEHLLKQVGTIECNGNILHGKKIVVETCTKKSKTGEFGKSTQLVYLD